MISESEYYLRPMVSRLVKIFDNPRPPKTITQEQFDGANEKLALMARKRWHEIGPPDYSSYLHDLCYVERLQQDLFDYVFPAFLIKWWEGQLDLYGGPGSLPDFYLAIDRCHAFKKLMTERRRQKTLNWMVDAYMEGVDHWGGSLSFVYQPNGPDRLHGPLWSFHAIGQSMPITEGILEKICEVSTVGRAQWWI